MTYYGYIRVITETQVKKAIGYWNRLPAFTNGKLKMSHSPPCSATKAAEKSKFSNSI